MQLAILGLWWTNRVKIGVTNECTESLLFLAVHLFGYDMCLLITTHSDLRRGLSPGPH